MRPKYATINDAYFINDPRIEDKSTEKMIEDRKYQRDNLKDVIEQVHMKVLGYKERNVD